MVPASKFEIRHPKNKNSATYRWTYLLGHGVLEMVSVDESEPPPPPKLVKLEIHYHI